MTPDVLADATVLPQLVADVTALLRRTAPELEPLTIELTTTGARLPGNRRTHAHERQQPTNRCRPEVLPDARVRGTPAHGEELRAAGQPPFVVSSGEKHTETPTLRAAVEHVIAQARKGLDIQRYKGLGK